MKATTRFCRVSLFITLALKAGSSGWAAETQWMGASSGSWNNLANWSSAAVPVTGDTIVYTNNGAANFIQSLDNDFSIAGLVFKDLASPVTINGGGAFTLTNLSAGLDLSAAAADLTILATYRPANNAPMRVGAGRTLTLSNVTANIGNQAGALFGPGTIRVVGTANRLDALTNSVTLVLDGGSIGGNPPTRLCAEPGGTVNIVMTNNAAISITGGNGTRIRLGDLGTGTNILTLWSGNINVLPSSGTSANGITAGDNDGATGILNVNGGSINMTNGANAFSMLRIADTPLAVGIVNLNGGAIVTPRIEGNQPTYDGTFNFNGGLFRATRTASYFGNLRLVQSLPGGAVIDSDAFNVTVSTAFSGPGGLTKLGTGTLILAGNDTYSGPTVVSNGTLSVKLPMSSSGLTLRSNAALTVAVLATSWPVPGGITMEGAVVNLDYGYSPSPNALTTGTLTLRGTNTLNLSGIGWTTGSHPLIQFSTIAGDGCLVLGKKPTGVVGTLATNANTIDLVVTAVAADLRWTGSVNGDWDINTTANWLDLALGVQTNYQENALAGDLVTFDTWALVTNINVAANVKPAQMTFSAPAMSFSLGGTGSIYGAGALIVNSPDGSVALNTSNSFTGGATLTAGEVRLGHSQALGTGPLGIQGATLLSTAGPVLLTNNVQFLNPSPYANATLGTNASPQLTIAGPVTLNSGRRVIYFGGDVVFSGTVSNGVIGKSGPATMTLASASHFRNNDFELYEGRTVVDGAFVWSAGGGVRLLNKVPNTVCELVVTNGGQLQVGGSATSASNMNLSANGDSGNGDPGATNVFTIYSGSVTFLPTNANGRIVLGQNASAALNVANLNGGIINGQGISGGLSPSELNLNGGTLKVTVGRQDFISGVNNAYVRSGGLTIDTAGLFARIPQSLVAPPAGASGGLTKIGDGILYLDGTNTYTGPTAINAGTLSGTGVISGPVTVSAAAVLAPGTGIGTLAISNTLFLAGTTIMQISRDSGTPQSDLVAGLTTLTCGGQLVVTNIGAAALVVNDVFKLFDAATIGPGTFSAVVLPVGYTWDSSQLYVSGTVRVSAVIAPNPKFAAPQLNGSSLVLSGSLGAPGGTYFLLTSTNVALPLGSWLPLSTNIYDSSGNFALTNTVDPAEPRRFYLLQSQ